MKKNEKIKEPLPPIRNCGGYGMLSDGCYLVRDSEIHFEESGAIRTMGCSVVPNSMLALALMASWSLCLSPVPGAVSGRVSDASVEPWFMQTGSEDVSKKQFYLVFSWPVSVPSGPVTGWVSHSCYAALMLMRFCGFAPVSRCGFCPVDAPYRWLSMSLYVLIWFRNL